MKTVKKETVVRLLLVDDHQCLVQGLSRLLEDDVDLRVVGTANGLQEAETEFVKTQPDLVLLDIQLKGESGFSFVPFVRQVRPQTKVVVFSTFENAVYRQCAERLGVDGYVAKGEDIASLKATIRRVAAQPGIGHAEGDDERCALKMLSQNEERVVASLAQGKTQKEVAAEIGISPSTVATHVQRAKEKLGARSLVEMLSLFGQTQMVR